MLVANAINSAREQLTLTRVYEELRGSGYDGSYDAVRRYAKVWRKERGAVTAEAYVPLSFAPGESYQFDSHELLKVKNFYRHIAISSLWLVQYPRSEPDCVTRPVSRTGSNAHSVAARNGCTTIPLALR